MSGTSGDGVDASIINSDGKGQFKVLINKYFEYTDGISENILNNQVELIASRYPNNSKWTTLASYMSLKYRPNSRLSFQTGIRYNKISIEADFVQLPLYHDSTPGE